MSSRDVNACSWDMRTDLTLNSMAQTHTSVTLLTSRDLTCSSCRLTCQWDVRGDLTSNSVAQIHTFVTLLMSRDLTWSSGQHASQISTVAHVS